MREINEIRNDDFLIKLMIWYLSCIIKNDLDW